ncbi:MAG: DUF397 domain-containing protein [Candidatus Portnoybacteria bacterium]|nr:DUF397 domain-containing protein [Candidatus Portnoybacteria bacterium]
MCRSSFFMEEFRPGEGCQGVECVTVKINNNTVMIRDTKTGDILNFSYDEWNTFLNGVKAGEFDV